MFFKQKIFVLLYLAACAGLEWLQFCLALRWSEGSVLTPGGTKHIPWLCCECLFTGICISHGAAILLPISVCSKFVLSFCLPNEWPSCVRGDISFYPDASIKSPCRLSPALLAFAHNSHLSNPVIWHFSWPAGPHFKVRWCNSTYLKVEVGNLADSLKKKIKIKATTWISLWKCEPTLHVGWLWSLQTLEPRGGGDVCVSRLSLEPGFA